MLKEIKKQMRTRTIQFTGIVRLPQQPSFVCANFAGIGCVWAGIDRDTDNSAISRPDYEKKYEYGRRT